MRNDTATRLKQIVLAITVTLLIAGVACRSTQQNLNKPPENTNGNSNTAAPVDTGIITAESPVVRTSTFDHFRAEHRVGADAKIKDCAVCHKRDTAAPSDPQVKQPNRDGWTPYHDSCEVCHNKENFRETSATVLKEKPLCAGCHKAEGNQIAISSGGGLKGVVIDYPKVETEFGIKGGAKGFSHKTHMDLQKMANEGQEVKCETCHQFGNRGIQASFPEHPNCFGCHSHQAGQKFGSCDVCHVKAQMAVSFSPGTGTAARLYNFRHSNSHLKAANCDRCHKTREIEAQAETDTKPPTDIMQISTARGQRHTSACWSCHSQARETVCTKCHVGSLPF